MKHVFVWTIIIGIFTILSACGTPTPTDLPEPVPSEVEIEPPITEIVFEFDQVVSRGSPNRELCVAFHSIQFLGQDDEILGVVLVGDDALGLTEAQGWYGPEISPEEVPFRWAGTAAKRASIDISIPDDTEGLLIRWWGVIDEIGVEVYLDGEKDTHVYIDNTSPAAVEDWRHGYVPVGEPQNPLPHTGGLYWDPDYYFPRFEQVNKLYIIRVETPLHNQPITWRENWRIDQSLKTTTALTLVSMQGLINRTGSYVFLDWQEPFNRSHFWVERIMEQQEELYLDQIHYLEFDGLSAINFLNRRFQDRFRGAVNYDPNIPDTINLATMISGLEDRVIVAPAQDGMDGMPVFGDGSMYDHSYILDDIENEYDWDRQDVARRKYLLYLWVYDNLWPDLEHRMISIMSPGPPSSGGISGICQTYYPLGIGARDYMVALKLPVLWLDPPYASDLLENRRECVAGHEVVFPGPDLPFPPELSDTKLQMEEEAVLFEQFLIDAYEPSWPTPVIGVYGNDESDTMALDTLYGSFEAAISRDNFPFSGNNVTVFSALRPDIVQYEPEIDMDRMFKTLGTQPVITLWNSDGDNYHYQMDRGFHGGVSWVWEDVQGHRFAWTMNPSMTDLAPFIWNYYVESRNEVGFISGFSGAGFMAPELMSETDLQAYLGFLGRYLDESGVQVVSASDRFSDYLFAPYGKASLYYQELQDTGYKGMFVGNHGWPWGLGFYYHDAPAPIANPSYILQVNNKEGIIEDLFARNAAEVVYDLAGECNWQWGNGRVTCGWQTGELVSDPDSLGIDDRVVLFSREPDGADDLKCPDHVVRGPFAVLAPGEYEARFLLKVNEDHVPPGTDMTKTVARLLVETGDEYWISTIYLGDFDTLGEYKVFDIPFSLTHTTPAVQVKIIYYGQCGASDPGSAYVDLYADTVAFRRIGGLDLPVYAGINISLMTGDSLVEIPSIAEEFETLGGLTLYPEEFMGSLNPEFMIAWAEQFIDPLDPRLDGARTHLEDGNYFESLMAVRQALINFPSNTFEFPVNSSCSLTLTANTWITDLELDLQPIPELTFMTHGPPRGQITASLDIPSTCPDEILEIRRAQIWIDGNSLDWEYQGEISGGRQGDVFRFIASFTQGPHSVQIK